MSFYEHRNASGEFTDLSGVHAGEQYGAGVNEYDNHLSAYQKVVNRRYALGLDPVTGLPPSTYVSTGVGSGAGYYDGSAPPAGAGWLGNAIAWCVKWLVAIPLLVAALMLIALAASAYANAALRDSGPGRGIAALVASQVAPGVALTAPGTYLTEKQIASARAGEPIVPANPRAKVAQPQLAAAYLCQLDADCSLRAERRLGWRAFDLGGAFLLDQAKRGSQSAARDLCLMSLLAGSGVAPVRRARLACSAAAVQARSPEAARLSKALEDSWAATAARPIEWAASAFCMEPVAVDCRLADAPKKVEYAARLALMGRSPW